MSGSTNTNNSGGTPSASPGAMSVEVETLTTFRNGVNELLSSLESGPAAPNQIAAQQLAAAHLGEGFQEVGQLMSRYQLVHEQLQTLSQTLTNQINAMNITLEVSQVGYQNVEATQVSTLWTIQTQTAAQQPPPSLQNQTVDQQIQNAGKAPSGSTGATTTSATTTSTNPGTTTNRGD